jgi:hypothetical protein
MAVDERLTPGVADAAQIGPDAADVGRRIERRFK